MQHTPVKSSFIESIAHDEDSATLQVRLKSGHTYEYTGVGDHEHAELMSATSIGQHYNTHIVGQYPSRKL